MLQRRRYDIRLSVMRMLYCTIILYSFTITEISPNSRKTFLKQIYENIEQVILVF